MEMDAGLRMQIKKDAKRNDEYLLSLLAAIDIPDLQVCYHDYGQQIAVSTSNGRGCFLRFGKNFADPKKSTEIRAYLLSGAGRPTRDEIFQFVR